MKLIKNTLIISLAIFSVSCSKIPDNEYEVVENKSFDFTEESKSEGLTFVSRIECPAPHGDENSIILVKNDPEGVYGVNYAIEWDCDKRAQRWTAFQMYKGNSGGSVGRNEQWSEDTEIPYEYRSRFDDYTGSGYDRGHMIASADRQVTESMNAQTYLLSNMHPQIHNFNAGVWASLEARIRAWNRDDIRDTLYVVKGGTIDGYDNILRYTYSGLIVPKYFFMAILCLKDETYNAIGFKLEHDGSISATADLKQFAVSIDELEEFTGIDFFPNLNSSTQTAVEKAVVLESWKWE